jgi:hypothetical protein
MAPFDDEETTPLFQVAPSVLLVAIPDGLAAACRRAAEPARTLRVAHAPAALQRMVTVLPLVIIIGTAIPAADGEAIRHHAEAIGARVMHESDLEEGEALDVQLRAAVRIAYHSRSTNGM